MNSNMPYSFEHLIKLNRANNQVFFLDDFNHMFNNPLNSIQMASELLKACFQDINTLIVEPELLMTDFTAEYGTIVENIPMLIQGISDSGLKLHQYVSWLSEFTGRGATAGQYGVDINWLISYSVSMVHHRIAGYTNSLTIDLDPNLPIVPGNAQLMLQVILNLLMNALISLPGQNYSVTLSTLYERATGRVQICITDEGSGIAPEIFPEILEPFFTTWQEHNCLGIGLTIADQIIRNHGGRLTIDSEPGKGTCVRVSLPLPAA